MRPSLFALKFEGEKSYGCIVRHSLTTNFVYNEEDPHLGIIVGCLLERSSGYYIGCSVGDLADCLKCRRLVSF